MGTLKDIRETKRALERLGVTVEASERARTGHIKLRLSYNGEHKFAVLPCSGSDYRGQKNLLSDIRKMFNIRQK